MAQISLTQNKKVRLNFELLEMFVAGVELLGNEVKALKGHQGTLEGSFIAIRGAEAFLVNMNLPAYQGANGVEGYDPLRTRKLLLTKREIETLGDIEKKKGFTIVPVSIYLVGKKIKVEIAIVRGKKKYDKRQTLKARTSKREMERTLKTQ